MHLIQSMLLPVPNLHLQYTTHQNNLINQKLQLSLLTTHQPSPHIILQHLQSQHINHLSQQNQLINHPKPPNQPTKLQNLKSLHMPHQSLLMLHQSQCISLSLATNHLPSRLTMHQLLLPPLKLTSHQADQPMLNLLHLISSMPDILQFTFTNNHQSWNKCMSHNSNSTSHHPRSRSTNHLHQQSQHTSQHSQPSQSISHSHPNPAMSPCLRLSPSIKNHQSKHTTPLHKSQLTNLNHRNLRTSLHLSHHTMLQLHQNLLMGLLQSQHSHRNPNISPSHRNLSTSLNHRNPNTNLSPQPSLPTNQDQANLLTSQNHPSSNTNKDHSNTSLLLDSNNTNNHPSLIQYTFPPQANTTSPQSSSTKVSALQSTCMKNLNQNLSINKRVTSKCCHTNGTQ